jgi:hypothetical protein
MTVRRFKKWNVINVIYIQKWYSLFSKKGHYVDLFPKFIDTPVNDRPSLFRIDSVYQMDLSFPRFVGLLILSLILYDLNICVICAGKYTVSIWSPNYRGVACEERINTSSYKNN